MRNKKGNWIINQQDKMKQQKSSQQKNHHPKQTMSLFQDRFKGALWGAVLGDVIGAFLEFSRGIDEQKIKLAFAVKGGGMHKLEPGQPTDDSQLAYAVGKGLLRGKGVLDLNKIATEMGNWFLSKPIDVGGTIRKSVPKACNMKEHQAYLCRKGASQCSKDSQSNGTLMAITPLSLWCVNLNTSDMFEAVKEYTILVHPNQLVIFCNVFYTMVLVKVIKRSNVEKEKDDLLEILNVVTEQFFQSIKQQNSYSSKSVEEFSNWIEFVKNCLTDSSLLQKQLDATKKSGWCRVAFTYSLSVLLLKLSFRNSLEYILASKGDTDTNACIAGGLIGAFYGFESIEKQMSTQISIIEKWRPKNVKRPEWMVPGLVVNNLADKLLEIAPTSLKIIGGSSEYKKK